MSGVRTLHHFPLDPASRQARLALAEKRLAFNEEVVRYWEQPEAFTALNPSGLTPVLVERTGELDVVARRGRTTVFCEVKTRTSGAYGSPAEAVTAARAKVSPAAADPSAINM